MRTYRKFSPIEVGGMLSQLAAALQTAHEQGLAHRDIKPTNILIEASSPGSYRLKLSDFGLVKDLNVEADLTATGYALGTPAYMAPEQAQGQAEPRSDLYSLGIILYELLTGWSPFTGTINSLLVQHATISPPPLRQFEPSIPLTLEAVILRAIAKTPQERYPTAMSLDVAYMQALQGDQELTNLILEPVTEIETLSIPLCPYRGLFAFREEDAAFFFGRTTFTAQLVETVVQGRQPLVAVIGPSGSGKSSVLFAGLVSQLRSEKDWLIASFRPGDNPFRNLATALSSLLDPELSDVERLITISKLTEAFRSGEVSLDDLISYLLGKYPAPRRVLLVADQFEELYTLGRDLEEQQRFLDLLLAALQPRPVSVFNLALSLRADFFGSALSYRPLADALQQAQFNLGPMNRQELQAVVEEPATRRGCRSRMA